MSGPQSFYNSQVIGGATSGVGGALVLTCALIMFICRFFSATHKCALCCGDSSRRRRVIYYIRDAPGEAEDTRDKETNLNQSQGETELSAPNNQKPIKFDLKPIYKVSALQSNPVPAYIGIENYEIGTQSRQMHVPSKPRTKSNSHVIININSTSTEV